MSDEVADREGRFPAGSALASALATSLRTPAAAWCLGVCAAALVSGIGAAAVSTHILNQSSALSAVQPAELEPEPKLRASVNPPAVAGFDVARTWREEHAQLAALSGTGLRAPVYNVWMPDVGLSTMLTTRLSVAGDGHLSGHDVDVATPLPLPRPDGIARPAVARAVPMVIEPRVAALPPQPQPNSGILDKLFGDPDRAAKAVLAANPNTALYDIAKRAVYLPDGEKLEAHSGFGQWMDDTESVHRKDVGVTPPNVYAVTFREKPFHGVRALRMKPVGDGNMYGRDGILAHSYLLGEQGASNGCISVRDYDKFLQAYEDGQFNRIIVLRNANEPAPSRVASAQGNGA